MQKSYVALKGPVDSRQQYVDMSKETVVLNSTHNVRSSVCLCSFLDLNSSS